jgi:uncharacterized protein
VTGASGGIGEALAYRFAEGGYSLVLVARSADRLTSVADRVRRQGGTVETVPLDLQSGDAGTILEAALDERGLTVDALVNNAGYGLAGDFLDLDLSDQLAMIDLNVRTLTDLCWRFGTRMRSRGSGGILNVASTAAFQPGPYMAVYYATKAYVLSFTEALNQELKGTGVHATALCPGPVRTGFQDRAGFDASMRLLRFAPAMMAEAVARAGFEAFRAKRPVAVPGLSNVVLAKGAPLMPRSLLLRTVAALQRKRP